MILNIVKGHLDIQEIFLYPEEGLRLDLCNALMRWWKDDRYNQPLRLSPSLLRHIDGLFLDFAMAGLVYRLYKGIWGNPPLQESLAKFPERKVHAPRLKEIHVRVDKHQETDDDWVHVTRCFKALIIVLRGTGYL